MVCLLLLYTVILTHQLSLLSTSMRLFMTPSIETIVPATLYITPLPSQSPPIKMRNQQDSPEPSAASSSSSAVPVAAPATAPPTPQSTRRLLGKVTLRGQTWLVLYMPRHVCEWCA